jgi:glycosyltransferase involved in cell wall biosynthesis
MNIFQLILSVFLGLVAAWWVLNFVLVLRIIFSVKHIEKLKFVEPKRWPKLSVVITACNEASTIEEAMKSRLEENYPDVEFILIDDRSTDSTTEIVDRIAASDKRVRPIHIKELPEGWLGKVNALNTGYKAAKGEWILFSDVDLHIKSGAVKRLIAYAESESYDHIVLAPEMWPKSFFLNVMYSVLIRTLLVGGRLWAIEDPKSTAAVGAGAFNLVRRSAFEKTKGFEWIKMETIDDVCIGQMIKESGGKIAAVNGKGWCGLYFYNSIGELARGFEKSFYPAIANFSLTLTLIMCLGTILEILPFIAFFLTVGKLALILAITGSTFSIAAMVTINYWLRGAIIGPIFWPIGAILWAGVAIRASILGKIRDGVYWRGTFYKNEALKNGKRFRL